MLGVPLGKAVGRIPGAVVSMDAVGSWVTTPIGLVGRPVETLVDGRRVAG